MNKQKKALLMMFKLVKKMMIEIIFLHVLDEVTCRPPEARGRAKAALNGVMDRWEEPGAGQMVGNTALILELR